MAFGVGEKCQVMHQSSHNPKLMNNTSFFFFCVFHSRSVIVIVENQTELTFKRLQHFTGAGVWSKLPPEEIVAKV
jgi:hypothetical protein